MTVSSRTFDVLSCGAVGDGAHLNTAAIQKAIDTAACAGGGTVTVPPGVYVTGTVHLRDRVVVDLAPGAVLRGSMNIEDYPPAGNNVNPQANMDLQRHHLIIADKVTDAGIRGGGTIDGSGEAFWDPPSTCEFFTAKSQRPSPMIDLFECENFFVDNVKVINSPGWTIHVHRCRNLRIHAVDIRNSLIGPNTDGLDITDSADIFVSDCNIVAGDDAIVLKSLGGVCERICVTNCVTQTRCSALKLGANESLGTIRQIVMSNCVVRDSSRGISLYNMTGGLFEDVTFSNIVLECHNDLALVCPIHINCSRNPNPDRDRGIGRIRNVRISDILVKSDARILLTAEDGAMLENVFLHHIHMEYPAVEDRFELARKAVGLQFSPFTPDARAAKAVVVAYNVKNLVLEGLTTEWPANPETALSVLWARNVSGGHIDCPLARAADSSVPQFDIEGCEGLTIRR